MRPSFMLWSACAFALATVLARGATSPAAKVNVLFIAADDLRADLGSYGHPEVKTPHLDALARRGVVFERAYCQQAVCNPSRASVLTGRRPDTLRVWNLQTHFRETLPDIVTLPQAFKQAGYTSVGLGKLFHNQSGPRRPPFPFADPPSWSRPPRLAEGAHWQDWVVPGDPAGPKAKGGPVQCLDVSDEAYFDGQIAAAAVTVLREFATSREPFFLGVGFWKPHLPFNAPKRYWDLYDRAKLAPPDPAAAPVGAPALAAHPWQELRGYAGMPQSGPLTPAQTAELRHGYLAAISFLDAQVGRVLAELERSGLAANTVVVFWSDHGFHLGEHNLWAKTSNYELDARVPLIIAAPGVARAGGRAIGLAELIDVYPTLTALAGLAADPALEGRSLVPQLRDPAGPGKPFALSQHPRPAYGAPTHMGYALRDDRFRYVEWRELATGAVAARELYDHRTDPRETVNRAADPAHREAMEKLAAQLRAVAPAARR
jgi:iduronate 2-sulfatase